ncbi:MAG: alpha-2-macroglobulin [Hyphomicrobiaceae bacterium]|nr:alpha-2-macroglobulin [Hyphomicrobiaceae bacterium]
MLDRSPFLRLPFLQALGLLALLMMAMAPAARAETKFGHAGVEADAKRYEAYLKSNWQPRKSVRELKDEGARAITAGSDFRAAARGYAQAVVAEAGDSESWTSLARALLAIKPDNSSERYELPSNASGAAYLAYARARTAKEKVAALWVLHEALKRRSYYRPAIDALAASLSIAENDEVRQAYDGLVDAHGFRILEYKVDADAEMPRLCIQFSERLAAGVSDWAKYFKVDGRDPQAVSAEARQICVDGLKHGKRYEVQVRDGLPSAIASEKLAKSADIAVYVRDRAPSVRATGRGYVLPNRGQQGIPLVTVNAQKVAVEVYRIGDRNLAQTLQGGDFQRQISSYDVEALKERTGAKVYAGELAVASKLNEDVTTAFPIAEAIPKLQPGVYVLTASLDDGRDPNRYRQPATQWFIVSDIGLTAINGEDGMHVLVRSIADATPIINTSLRLLARNNEVLATARTDSRGYARFDASAKRGEGGQAPAVVVAETEGDYAFLDITTAAFDLADRGVKGRSAPGPVDAFVYSDRGVYRPGESVHLTALARDRAGQAASVPLTLIYTRPDGVEHSRVALADEGLGGRATRFNLAGGAMTGTWRVRVHTDPKAAAIAQASFLVEDFVPERLELKLEPGVAALVPEAPGSVKLAGRYLYGPPAAGLAIEGEIAVKAMTRDVPGFAGYRFGAADEAFAPIRKPLEGLPATDGEGRADIQVVLPALPRTAKPLEADVILKLRETGGRTIERTVSLPVDMGQARIGVKPLFTNNQAPEGDIAHFEAIMLDAAGKRIAARGLKWEVLRLEQRYQWYSRDGAWNYEPITSTRRVAGGSIDIKDGEPARIAARLTWGRYRLEVSSGDGLITSYVFSSGYYADEAADSPEMLDVVLDKPSYQAGDTARVKIASRSGGRAFVAVLGSGLVASQEADIPAGGGEIPLKVADSWSPGAYVTVMLYRPMDEGAKRMPSRALGLKWLALDQSARTLTVSADLPEKVKSGTRLEVPVKVQGLAAGEEARVTVAAVDVGILNLTRFDTPKPQDWFFGQRRMGADIRDLYGRLIDGMRAERGRLRSGGDGSASGLTLQGTPPVEATVAMFSGIVRVGSDGTARVAFDMPDFNGTVRLSMVAWSAGKVGSASRDVIVRDQVAVTAAAPRFLTLGDTARLELALHNVDGKAGSYTITGRYEADGAGKSQPGFERAVALAQGERKREAFELSPAEVGLTRLAVRVTGPDGIDIARTLTFDVKVPAGDVRRLTVSSLSKGGKLTLSGALLQDLVPRTARLTVTMGPSAGFDVPGLLASLDRYPYGCAEQTTSRALPLLYVNDVARRIGLASDDRIKERIEKAIARVLDLQDASGAFGIWGPSDGDMWLTSYVTDFLTRAKEKRYSVPEVAFKQALDRLQNYIGYAKDFQQGGEGRAYALYVLSRNGRAPVGELRYYADTKLESFSTPLAQAHLGAALAMTGDKVRAEAAFAAALKAVGEPADVVTRRDYGTSMRDGAALIALASEAGVGKAALPRMVDIVAKAYKAKTYTSTQEQAWMLLAARALAEEGQGMRLSLNGATHRGQLVKGLGAEDLKAGPLGIVNEGEAAVDAVVSVIGAALTPEPASARGFTLERSYYTLDGKQVDLKSAEGGTSTLKQTDRLVVVLKVKAAETGGRILLVDRLPAGLEIENPRIVDSGDLKSFGWLKTTLKPQHSEFRDDRFVAAFDFFGKSGRRNGDGDDDDAEPASEATVAYLVRAVTPGSFVHPAATVEDMYNPERFARSASGRLEVTAKD